MKLYEISTSILQALDAIEIDPETGECFGLDGLDMLQDDFDQKAENIACYIKGLLADVEAMKTEEHALAGRRQTLCRKIDSMKDYLAQQMHVIGKTKLAMPRAAISFRKSTRVEITDMDALPDAYKRQKITIEPDKTAIKKAGTEIAGAKIIESQNIQIK